MQRWCLGVASVVLFAVTGCGPGQVSVYPVKGKLTQARQPLGDVHLVLSPTGQGESPFASADVAADGTFELKCSDGRMGAAAGSYKVVLSSKAAADPMAAMTAMRDQMQAKGGAMDPKKMAPKEPFPPAYRDPKTSPKTVEIKPSELTIEIDI